MPMNKYLKILLVAIFAANPLLCSAAFKSQSYVIYENVNHVFDGPVISGISHSVSGNKATVVWNTGVIADGFVIYSKDSSFATSREQGSSEKAGTSHSVEVTGLDYSSTYYYKVRSKRVNGGETVSGLAGSFSTGANPVSSSTPVQSPASGGTLIIDKTDTIAPIISNLDYRIIATNTLEVTWTTDEKSTSFVEYGETMDYGLVSGHWEEVTEHRVVLELDYGRQYQFRVLSSDSWANAAYSANNTAITAPEMTEEEQKKIEEEQKKIEEEAKTETDQTVLIEATRRAIEFIKKIFPEVSINEQTGFSQIGTLDDFSNFFPAPILSGEPKVEVTATEATIRWYTDVDSTSQVRLAPEPSYNSKAAQPYQQVVGDAATRAKEHVVKIYGLKPNTLYHYQLQSKGVLGPVAFSRDFTFKTSIEGLEITNFFAQVVDRQTAVFKWVTNKDANSAVRLTPYHGNVIAVEESKTFKDNATVIMHEMKVAELQEGVIYDVELSSTDNMGRIASKKIEQFSTSKDDLPPVVSHIKTDSTIFIDKSNKIQTVISWLTNEPATSRVYYQEGVLGADAQLSESTDLSDSYTKEHVLVVTKFKPGTVYSFRVESIDSGGNVSMSKTHTFMTAKQKDSIIQIILRVLENTFGWVKNLRS